MVPNSRTHMNDTLGQPRKIRTLLVVLKVSTLHRFYCTRKYICTDVHARALRECTGVQLPGHQVYNYQDTRCTTTRTPGVQLPGHQVYNYQDTRCTTTRTPGVQLPGHQVYNHQDTRCTTSRTPGVQLAGHQVYNYQDTRCTTTRTPGVQLPGHQVYNYQDTRCTTTRTPGVQLPGHQVYVRTVKLGQKVTAYNINLFTTTTHMAGTDSMVSVLNVLATTTTW